MGASDFLTPKRDRTSNLRVARDLAKDGIRVAAILPGLFHTPMFDGLPDEARDSLAASVPFPSRLGSPSEYAQLAVSICENVMLNGVNIVSAVEMVVSRIFDLIRKLPGVLTIRGADADNPECQVQPKPR